MEVTRNGQGRRKIPDDRNYREQRAREERTRTFEHSGTASGAGVRNRPSVRTEDSISMRLWQGFLRLVADMRENRKNKMDWFLLFMIVGVLAAGLLMLYSASYPYAYYNEGGDGAYYLKRQLLFAVLGLIGMYATSLLPMWFLRKCATGLIAISIFLLALLYVLPKYGGERRWINLGGGFTFQPSEMAKFAVILFLAKWYDQNRNRVHQFGTGVCVPAVAVAVIGCLILFETHLSGFILITLIGMTIMFIAGIKLRWFGILFALLAAGGSAVLMFTDYMKTRLTVWLDPFSDRLGDGWQNIQANYAISLGGLGGLGFTESRQKYLYISEPQNDFIFAVVCEELGFIGATIVLLAFVVLVWRGLSVSMSSTSRFQQLLGIGISAQIGWQTLLNVGVVTRALPNTGISLPFFSSGGTSLFILLLSMGVLLAVSRNSVKKTV
ncbi:MAG: putative lipid II flippase FtsW [Oscillospiraceae bacterium]|jgi:cell division protein FtsW|nr:putative lipid II flippase FtsW [Oscillospiraceae bacterium]